MHWMILGLGAFIFQFCGEQQPDNQQMPDVDSVFTNVKTDTTFMPGVPQGLIENEALTEASGIVVSRSNPSALWVHNDSGDEARLFLIGNSGEDYGQFVLKDANNRDWEDIAIGPGPEENTTYLYVADIGDNIAQYDEKIIYRFKEPDVINTTSLYDAEISEVETIRFKFPDGNRDAETLLIDPSTKDLYIISKRELSVSIYQLTYPYATNKIHSVTKVGQLNLSNVVGGDISADGKSILVKTYTAIYCWEKKDGETIAETLAKDGVRLPYFREPQGEAIGWNIDGSGYFTLSEEFQGIDASLIYYQRL